MSVLFSSCPDWCYWIIVSACVCVLLLKMNYTKHMSSVCTTHWRPPYLNCAIMSTQDLVSFILHHLFTYCLSTIGSFTLFEWTLQWAVCIIRSHPRCLSALSDVYIHLGQYTTFLLIFARHAVLKRLSKSWANIDIIDTLSPWCHRCHALFHMCSHVFVITFVCQAWCDIVGLFQVLILLMSRTMSASILN